ncbi:hypothetical protein [Photorhabdus khanii]|uniref:Uncharacterized protein n=1 Tax=Photorhabdus khanii subsp. guanajuatensis TaxID=2100166 RepID=A0A4R4JXG6_9GAMM|nr:hypothetical protein [Photorhabdus khanii]TDB59474.1 hypothetical protein C5467_08785 [Photorhabdus khanii subsp. guanajuatensis]
MDIEVNSPINITLDMMEVDEHLPSIKFDIMIRVKKFSYSLEANSQVWVECQVFDMFIDSIRKDNIATLSDMNGLFELKLDPVQGCLKWSCSKEDLDSYITLAKGEEKLTDELKWLLYKAFNDYPRWW